MQVPCSIRALAASRLARDGRTWAAYFSRGRGLVRLGKQWSVVDLTKLGDNEADGLLWVVEQIVGVIMASDKTDILRSDGYWASYGLPFHQEVRQVMHLPEGKEELYSYANGERAQVFNRCRFNCTNKQEIFQLMRHAVKPSRDLLGARADLYENNPLPYGLIDTKIVTGTNCHFLIYVPTCSTR